MRRFHSPLALLVFFISLVLSSLASGATVTDSPSTLASLEWLASMDGKDTNVVVRDPRFGALLKREVPPLKIYLGMSRKDVPEPLADAVDDVMDGPPEPVDIREGRFVMMSACRPHSCTEKGFVWVDTQEHMVIGGVVHFFYKSHSGESGRSLLLWSKQAVPHDFPREFVNALNRWGGGPLKVVSNATAGTRNEYSHVRFVGVDGVAVSVSSDDMP